MCTGAPVAAFFFFRGLADADPEVRVRAWQTRIESPAWAARPNPGHQALVELERRGKLHAIVTQNVDELHQRAGSSPELVVEVHGTMFRTKCWDCGFRTSQARSRSCTECMAAIITSSPSIRTHS